LSVDRVKLVVYTFPPRLGLRLVLVSRVTTTTHGYGNRYELDVIAAVVLEESSIFAARHHLGHRDRPRYDPAPQERAALTGVKGDATIVVIGVALILSVLIASSLQRRRD